MEFNVLSLFDGCSGGQQALERINKKVDTYYASEIDKSAIEVTMANYPNTIQLGSVTGVDVSKLKPINLLIGGSPCQSFSFAGKRKGMSTKDNIEILTLEHYLELKSQNFEFEGQSYLFWEYIRILTEATPKYFLLENVMMGEKWEKVLSKAIGINALPINSALVSAQNRKRLYWFGQIRERLFYNDNYCYICRHEQENGGIQDKSQAKGSSKILGETQERQVNLQNLRIGISENRKERNDKNLFCYMPREKQETIRQEQVQNNEKHLPERISEKEQGKAFSVSEELSTDYEGKGVVGKNGGESIKENSKKNENSSSPGTNWSKEEAEQRRIDYYSKYGEDMCCVQCGKRLNHRPQTSFVKGWNKLTGKSPSTLSEVQFNEARQNNGRVFDILEIGVIGEDMFGEVINQIPQPKDKGTLLKDILEPEVDEKYYIKNPKFGFYGLDIQGKGNTLRVGGHGSQTDKHNYDIVKIDIKGNIKNNQDKASCFTAGAHSGGNHSDMDLIQIVAMRGRNPENTSDRTKGCPTKQMLEAREDGKTNCITTVQKDNLVYTANYLQYGDGYDLDNRAYYEDGKQGTLDTKPNRAKTLLNTSRIRRLTPLECERLQTMKDGYTAHVSDSQRYKMIGNGWTIEVIAHIFSYLN